MKTDAGRWMAVAAALSGRARALSSPNPNVGCLLVKDDLVVGRGWTQAGGRPHAEAMALAEAGERARGATAYVTLEPCAHESLRGPSCADSLIAAGVGRVVAALTDPDPRTAGKGFARLEAAGIAVVRDVGAPLARAAMAGWLSRIERGRAFVTLKLATSLDGCIAMANGESRWITREAARAHAHVERARSNMILVGRGTYQADAPRLDVRLTGLEERAPRRALLSRSADLIKDWEGYASPEAAASAEGVDWLLVEGGAQTAAAFLCAGLVDRIMLYRAPILVGGGTPCLSDIGLERLGDAHGQWHRRDTRTLGPDSLEVYERLS